MSETDKEKFEENLQIYGADLDTWSDESAQYWVEALADSHELRKLHAEYKKLEEILLSRKYEEPSQDLADRISYAALQRGRAKKTSPIKGFLDELLSGIHFPLPRYALASLLVFSMLISGFATGYALSEQSYSQTTEAYVTQSDIYDFLYYEGEML